MERLTLIFILAQALALGSPLTAAPAAAKAPATPMPASAPVAPAAVSASAGAAAAPEALSPSAAALSPTAAAEEPVLPEEVEDPTAAGTQASLTDLKPLSSTVLAKLASALGPEQETVYLDSESGEAVDAGASGSARVDATALFAELARRMAREDDKDARAALALAILKKDQRAKEAKDLAYEAKLADSVIGQIEGGNAKAKAELEALAKKGNARARQYLGLDGPPPSVSAPAPAAAPLSPTASAPATPAAVSPAAKP